MSRRKREPEGRKILNLLREKGQELEIPKRLHPDQMRVILQEQEETRRKTHFFRRKIFPRLYPHSEQGPEEAAHPHGMHLYPGYAFPALAACVCLAVGMMFLLRQADLRSPDGISEQIQTDAPETAGLPVQEAIPEETQELEELKESSYGEIYACLSKVWQAQETLAEEEMYSALDNADIQAAVPADSARKEELKQSFGKTNTQVEQIDEGDRIKNDGRYLYQIAGKRQEGGGEYDRITGIQILDTEGGLKETAFLGGFENLEEFYVWENRLITIENKYYSYGDCLPVERKGRFTEDLAVCGGLREESYHEISIYEISDRSRPRKLKTFTLQGNYESSRVAEGYFYGISRFCASPGEGAQDYDAYIPSLDGKRMEPDQIYCPSDADSQEYLVLVSIDLSEPSSLADSRAVLAGSGTYYVSTQNIYVAWYQSVYEAEPEGEGSMKDATRLLRFSYQKGRFYAQAEGEIPGRLDDSFSMDEYEGKLRLVSTVQEYDIREITDDRTGGHLGYDYGEVRETSGLYILDSSLTITGKIEGLAEGEQIRSARFLGDTGYFVTFRQTDPLFAADLSDPEAPRILGELKVSGFSEYLHFYGENSLLGIGMEADEETGREQGMKLSMFDISDPARPKETVRYALNEYDYSEALWDHRAVLIDPEENIIGFEARGDREDYLIFSYRDGAFVQELKVDIRLRDQGGCTVRGTFIGDRFYLLYGNGSAQAYDRNTKELVSEL